MATRTGALDAVLDHLPDGSIVVATTGITSREVYAYRERHGQDHGSDFLTVGSMGHASQIALGVALQQPSRPVICLDGDGAVLMHMGGLAVIGTEAPANYHHVVLNNGAHDSVGGQPTAARHLNLSDIARACGYPRADVVRDVAAVGGTLGEHLVEDGPTFLEVKVASDPNTTAGRPTTSPAENKAALMRTLGIG
jgi:phosphonopyruvate decarboxylase